MKRQLIMFASLLLGTALLLNYSFATANEDRDTVTDEQVPPMPEGLESLEQRVSYIIGINMGRDMKQNGVEVDFDALRAGFDDATQGNEPKLSNEQMQQSMMEFQMRMMQRMQEMAAENLRQGQAFLEENAQREGVVVLESGVQYKVLEAGDGPRPGPNDMVSVHYRGSLVDGSEFESSFGGEPATFPVRGVIPGFSEALQLMPVGSRWQVFIPSHLAYGEQGGPGGPNATLIFELQLLEIVEGGQPQPLPLPQP